MQISKVTVGNYSRIAEACWLWLQPGMKTWFVWLQALLERSSRPGRNPLHSLAFCALLAEGKGANCILGPSINVHRSAAGGRNFEYLSGEAHGFDVLGVLMPSYAPVCLASKRQDGYLGAKLTSAYVRGVQDGNARIFQLQSVCMHNRFLCQKEQGVIATAKHFAFNEQARPQELVSPTAELPESMQETNRMSMDARISEAWRNSEPVSPLAPGTCS